MRSDKKFFNSLEYYCYVGKHYWGKETLDWIEPKICLECSEKIIKKN
jgi:hypothetical protein